MKILINLATLKKGGGQNVGLNFVQSFLRVAPSDVDAYFVVARGTEIERFVIQSGLKILGTVPQNPLLRMVAEILKLNAKVKRLKIDVIYSCFGLGLYTNNIPQISGSADSNLYFPEIDFWQHYRGLGRLKKYIVDQYRIYGLKKSHAVVFENEAMKQRAGRLFGLTETKYIKPSVNFDYENEEFLLKSNKDTSKGLFLCGWQLNKNIMLIPEIANILQRRGVRFQFIFTANDDQSLECKKFKNLLTKFGVEDNVKIVGQLSKKYLASIYQQIDFVFLLSKLESFSNNIIEAWYFGKPLIVADEKWSRSICDEAAVYVDRDNPVVIADAIEKLLLEPQLSESIKLRGLSKLKQYPSIDERTLQEIEYAKVIAREF
ncbi:glycosyltransferase [Glaciecola petra]|uniref:Glycosyltransferase n=1 Tax=Glaciecola petra TaxID=3075602 RepID=A0ABU2ZM25_9ALTE|nr:glycosyltransferase [Aestuariibacter sp. P117]MDT0593668.1 glycosyltransferase [Aestuariibacter sp. P117]